MSSDFLNGSVFTDFSKTRGKDMSGDMRSARLCKGENFLNMKLILNERMRT